MLSIDSANSYKERNIQFLYSLWQQMLLSNQLKQGLMLIYTVNSEIITLLKFNDFLKTIIMFFIITIYK